MAFPFTGSLPTRVITMTNCKVVNASGTFTALEGPGVLGELVVYGGTMGVLSITDNTAASGGAGNILSCTPVTGAAASPMMFHLPLNVPVSLGAAIFTSAATEYYVSFTRG